MLKTVGLAISALVGSGIPVNAQSACEIYTVKGGDTLSLIAQSAYGDTSFQELWDANRSVIGGDPNRISVGMLLRMPCTDGTLPMTSASATEVVDAPQPASRQSLDLRLVTGSGYPPFTDEGMEGGGVYAQLVRAAMDTMEPDVTTSITFVNDWGSHLETLLPVVAFDGAFPWLRPNCEQPETLTENSTFRCEQFIHSDPFYEITTVLTVVEDSGLATTDSYEDFHGTTVCLPDGYTDAALAVGGLVEPVVNYVRPVDPQECVQLLAAGEVDVVSLELRLVENAIEQLGFENRFQSNPNLVVTNVLSVFVSKNHPNGEEVIDMLNEGLANIRESGVWFSTVRSGFRAFYEG